MIRTYAVRPSPVSRKMDGQLAISLLLVAACLSMPDVMTIMTAALDSLVCTVAVLGLLHPLTHLHLSQLHQLFPSL